jgi:hypothetical protein
MEVILAGALVVAAVESVVSVDDPVVPVVSVDPVVCTEVWSVAVGDPVVGTPVLVPGRVSVGTGALVGTSVEPDEVVTGGTPVVIPVPVVPVVAPVVAPVAWVEPVTIGGKLVSRPVGELPAVVVGTASVPA